MKINGTVFRQKAMIQVFCLHLLVYFCYFGTFVNKDHSQLTTKAVFTQAETVIHLLLWNWIKGNSFTMGIKRPAGRALTSFHLWSTEPKGRDVSCIPKRMNSRLYYPSKRKKGFLLPWLQPSQPRTVTTHAMQNHYTWTLNLLLKTFVYKSLSQLSLSFIKE